jgi:hypothetical protein
MNEFYNKMKFFENTEKIPAETYYHYTSLEALYSIITNKTFWLTSLKSSSDKRELHYNLDTFVSDFTYLIDNEKEAGIQEYFRLIKTSIEENKDKFYEEHKQKAIPYAMCLSEKKDNLTHWDRYAFGCTGVCIGFNISSLRVQMKRMAITAIGIGLYHIDKVLYTSVQRRKHIKNMFLRLLELFLREGTKAKISNVHDLIKNNGYLYASAAFKQLMPFSKDSSFVDEDEVRLYHDANSVNAALHLIDSFREELELEFVERIKKNFLEFVDQLHIKEDHFCLTKRGIRIYKELCLKEVWGSGTIPEIILGPLCVQNRKELNAFLKANGLKGTRVSVSKVPIR